MRGVYEQGMIWSIRFNLNGCRSFGAENGLILSTEMIDISISVNVIVNTASMLGFIVGKLLVTNGRQHD